VNSVVIGTAELEVGNEKRAKKGWRNMHERSEREREEAKKKEKDGERREDKRRAKGLRFKVM